MYGSKDPSFSTMRAMFTLLPVVALIATSNAVFVEFSEDAYELILSAITKESKQYAAEVINANHEYKLNLSCDEATDSEREALLYPDELTGSESAQQTGHSICGNALGLDITDLGIFCNPSHFLVGVDDFIELYTLGELENSESEEEKKALLDRSTMYFVINFKSSKTKLSTLGIPIFKIPSEIDSSDGDKVRAWAAANKVGLLSPSEIQSLSAVNKEQGWTLNFKWLSDLLQYGVTLSVRDSQEVLSDYEEDPSDSEEVAVIARPIAISGEHLSELESWIISGYPRRL